MEQTRTSQDIYIEVLQLTNPIIAVWPYLGLSNGGTNFYTANLFLLHYFLTVILLYIMFTRATRIWATFAKATWAKVVFNLLLYIHGGHKEHKTPICLELLKKVDEFRRWSEELLDELCDYAKPISYAEHDEIVRRGSSIDEMLFLVQGKLQTYSLTSVDTGSAASPPRFEISINHLEDGEFCGEELVAWFQADLYSSNLPISNKTIKTIKKVDAFALMSYDLQSLFIKSQTTLCTSTQVQAPPSADSYPQAPVSRRASNTAARKWDLRSLLFHSLLLHQGKRKP
ncbi:hypothetical protein Ddye_001370 [Dipteronia dyeriana]|uniref:Cyclic nucleotide-binding domain-containing protein n=1 Tax=Dipteronia dyeriana TaxID=168575 RepID=A0AAD9XNY0_9ROSI|nr:hypothetical protein Ddye_001370 [Dipteronia dyeriana]